MPTVPVANQIRRTVRTTDGSVKFEVTTRITERGDLPFTDLFVLKINDAADPKAETLARVATPLDIRQSDVNTPIYVKVLASDVITISGDPFARVGNINDVTALPRDRTQAVNEGRTEYLSSSVTVLYDNVTTADAAYKQFLSRLSSLVNEWRKYQTGFQTLPSQSYDLPLVDPSIEGERVRDYAVKKAARKAAEAARDAAKAASDACDLGCASDKIIHDFLVSDVAFLTTAKRLVQNTVETATGTLNLSGGTTLTAPGTYTITTAPSNTVKSFALNGTDPASYEALLTAKTAKLLEYQTKVRVCAEQCAALSAALLSAQATVAAAVDAENAALAAVLVVCPTFDSSTI